MAKKTTREKLNSVGSYANEYMLNNLNPDNIDYKTIQGKIKNNYVNTKNNPSVLFKAKNSPSYTTQLTGSYLYKTVSSNIKDYVNNWSVTIRPKDVVNLIGLML